MKNYQEGKPYIFVSYPHKSKDIILPILRQLDEYGYPLWWDEGIEYGTNYNDYIAEHLENSSGMLLFLFEGTSESKYCINEIDFADELGKTIIPVRDTRVKLPPGLRMRFTNKQSFMVDDYADISVIINGLDNHSEFSQFRIIKDMTSTTKVEIKANTQKNSLIKYKSYIKGPDYSNQIFSRVDFSQLNLKGANFTNATLYFCKLNGNDLTNANFKGANLTGTRMIGCVLEDINLEKTIIDFVDFSDTKINKGNIQTLGAKTKHYPIDEFSSYNQGILLGKYEGEDIRCRALDYDENKNELLMITEDIIDCKRYHQKKTDITWEECDLRKYLNSQMYHSIQFYPNIKIVMSQNKNDINPEHQTVGGNPTMDYLFLLSTQEVNEYFIDHQDQVAKPTKCAMQKKQDGCSLYVDEETNNSYWWLRTPGIHYDRTTSIQFDGIISYSGITNNFAHRGVRPALRIKFDK